MVTTAMISQVLIKYSCLEIWVCGRKNIFKLLLMKIFRSEQNYETAIKYTYTVIIVID